MTSKYIKIFTAICLIVSFAIGGALILTDNQNNSSAQYEMAFDLPEKPIIPRT